jgi:NADPH:quinone reductase-like Zn-dependent oxidoreductase
MSKKVIQRAFGGPDVLEIVDEPDPSAEDLEADQVLVRVSFAGVNPVDAKTRAGKGVSSLMGELPFTVGWDLAGTVASVGAHVTDLSVGDRVFGMSRFPYQAAAYAQFAIVAAADLVPTPDQLSDENAAALPLASLTAWQQLVRTAGVTRGDRVLIHGAGGGVGHLAVQIAHDIGATVLVTASTAKHDWLKQLGADQAIDYATENFVDILRDDRVDVVLDLVSGPTVADSFEITKPGGVVIVVPESMSDSLRAAAAAAGVRVEAPPVHLDRESLIELADLAARGQLVPTVSRTYPLDQVRDAHESIEHGHTLGKTVLSIG